MAKFLIKQSLVKVVLAAVLLGVFGFSFAQQDSQQPLIPTRIEQIPAPSGFKRVVLPDNSYAMYLRQRPLKHNKEIELHTGGVLHSNTYNTLAVVDAPLLFTEDLEQCADFAMRFWAEYLQQQDELAQLALFDFNGRKRPFRKANKSFEQYLKWHMVHSNSYSLKRGAEKLGPLSLAKAGDMIVQNDSDGGIGHVSLVMDEAVNATGIRVYLIGYSFMPAQEFHLEASSADLGFDGWFTATGMQRYFSSVFGSFGQPQLMRFTRDTP